MIGKKAKEVSRNARMTRPHAVGDIPPTGVYIPAIGPEDRPAGSKALGGAPGGAPSPSPGVHKPDAFGLESGLVRGHGGRFLNRTERIRAVRRGLVKRKATLERSMAHRPNARPADLERWSRMRTEIALFEFTLAELLAGREPAPSPRTGSKTRALPDRIGDDDGR